jgi:iron complex transport system substrate-binding protein
VKHLPIVFIVGLLLGALPFSAAALEIEDIIGRKVILNGPAEKVLLGEGRFLVAVSLLDPEKPVSRVAGLLNEFKRFDPTGFSRYTKAFPELKKVPIFGQTSEESVSLEKAIMLKPDAAIFGVSGHGPKESSLQMIESLEAAGVPVVFIDFRDDPLGKTSKSMRILGRVLGCEEKAERFASFHEAQTARVVDRLKGFKGKRPTVLLEARVGFGGQCCFTMASGMFADLIEAAGGDNIAAGRLPGATGVLNLEYVLEADPEVYIGSAIGSKESGIANGRIVLGAGISPETARASLAVAVARPGLDKMQAIQNGRAIGIWHHFYNSPFNVYALQAMAERLHPELFADLKAEKTLQTMLDWIGPVDLSGTYAVNLVDDDKETVSK